MASPMVQTRSDEDSTGRCPPVSLVSGSVPLGFNHSVKIQILLSTVGVNLPSLLARRCKRPNEIHSGKSRRWAALGGKKRTYRPFFWFTSEIKELME